MSCEMCGTELNLCDEHANSMLREITLVVDNEWFKAISNLTSDVYDGETCEWLRVEVL